MRRGSVTGWVLALAAGVMLLAVAGQSLRPRLAAARLPTGAAQWIWAGVDETGEPPYAFFAARDFELASPPPAAELLIQADEEYLATLNGSRVGSNGYRPGAALDRYEVAGLLRPGANRLVVELRSGSRAGGLLARLRAAGGLDLVSGPDWHILMRYRGRQEDPSRPLVRPYPPRSWGMPTIGRWRRPVVGPLRPLFDEVRNPRRRALPERVRSETDPGWRPAPPPRPGAPILGRVVSFDFGAETTGYLGLVFGSRLWPSALLYAGTEPPEPDAGPPAGVALGPRGRLAWEDAVARRFRYVTVLCPGGVRAAYALPVDPRLAPPVPSAAATRAGVFGIADPPLLVSPVEDEIRRELEGLAGLPVGEPG